MKHLTTATLDAYAEGMLEPSERAAADRHLAECAACRVALVTLAQVGDLLRAQPRAAAPPDLAPSIISRLRPRALARRAWRWPRAALSGLGAALAWLLLVILGGETVLAAREGGLGDLAALLQARPDVLTRYPAESFYALLEALPWLELGLTLVVLVVALWLVQRFVAALPEWSRA